MPEEIVPGLARLSLPLPNDSLGSVNVYAVMSADGLRLIELRIFREVDEEYCLLPTVVAPYARRTTRLADIFTLIAFAIGGEAGKRLMAGMGLATSPDTLLRLIRTHPENQVPTPRVLGLDDFWFYKRKIYGTILVDLEKRMPVDLLSDREATSVAKWFKEHPGVEIVSRDRAGPDSGRFF